MKKIVLLAMAMLVLTIGGCAADPDSTAEPTGPSYPYDYTKTSFFSIENCMNYAPEATLIGIDGGRQPFDLKGTSDGYSVAQGAAGDGTYGYFALVNPNAVVDGVAQEACRVIKVDLSTWEIVQESEPLRTCHSNGMAYNSKTHQLLIVHNKPEFTKISVVDADTLQVVRVVEVGRYIQSIGYNAKRDQYVVRMSGNWNFAILDSEFNEVSYHETGVTTPLGSQCMTCDDNYIYMLDSGVTKMPGVECVTLYDWDGNYLGVYRIPSFQESEALIIHNDKMYVTFFNGSGARMYQITMDLSLLNYSK